MPMLHPCPRCSQALPSTASFCRRCGASVDPWVRGDTRVGFSRAPVIPAPMVPAPMIPAPPAVNRATPSKAGSWVTPILTGAIVAALIVAVMMFWTVHAQSTAVQTVPVLTPTYSSPTAQPIYSSPAPVMPVFPQYRPVIVQPIQPDRDRYWDSRGEVRHQGR